MNLVVVFEVRGELAHFRDMTCLGQGQPLLLEQSQRKLLL